jgi:four helix bundle protein
MFQEAKGLTKEIYLLTNEVGFDKDYGLKDQIRRASISIISNIAEGYERNSNKEFIKFLGYSKGSCGEVRAQLIIAKEIGYFDDDTFEILYDKTKHISAMISNFIKALKNHE